LRCFDAVRSLQPLERGAPPVDAESDPVCGLCVRRRIGETRQPSIPRSCLVSLPRIGTDGLEPLFCLLVVTGFEPVNSRLELRLQRGELGLRPLLLGSLQYA
jgi:hypothetical protein